MSTKRRKRKKSLDGGDSREGFSNTKVILTVFGLATAGGLGFLVWDKFKNKNPTIIINNALNPIKNLATKMSRNDRFPLKRGSLGTRVKKLQEALAKILGGTGMANYGGIDGDYGPLTEKALQKANLPTVVDEAGYNNILSMGETTGGNLKIIFDPSEIAKDLFYAARSINLPEVIKQLRLIKNSQEYQDVSVPYQKNKLVRRTIVTDLLDFAFKDNDAAKAQIKDEFLRIGLKNDAATSKWSLNGFRLYNDIMTLRNTYVEDMQKNKIPVREGIILGDELETSNGMTFFRAMDNTIGAAPSKDVKSVG